MKKYLTSQEAVKALGITPATLYAYVSRGMIRSEAGDKTHRERRYLAEDVMKLVERREQRNDPSKTAQAAMHWGMPVLDSALTLISENGLYYRGMDVAELAREHTFEEVAALLWTGEINTWKQISVDEPNQHIKPDRLQPGRFLPNIQIALALAADSDWQAWQLHPKSVQQTGARILHLLTQAISYPQNYSGSIAEKLAQAWNTQENLINRVLILCADHELNASSFTARVVASTNANLYAVVAGGLAALTGAKHGGYAIRVAAMFRELDSATDRNTMEYILRERVQRGDGIPGFGHKLYPAGDPRALILMDALKASVNSDKLQRDLEIMSMIREMIREEPTIDLALALMERALNLPNGSAFALFALGRTAGWIAHALEQYALDSLIRPRARYVGKTPNSNEAESI